jgi:transposase
MRSSSRSTAAKHRRFRADRDCPRAANGAHPLRGPGRQGEPRRPARQILRLLRRHRYRLWRTWELKEQLRDLYRSTDPAEARAYLKRWCTSAKRSRIPAFVNLVRRIEKHFDAIIAAVELGLSNSRLEGINAKIRLIQRRGYGFRNLDALTAALYLCLGGITLNLPTER